MSQAMIAAEFEYLKELKRDGVLTHSCLNEHEYKIFSHHYEKSVYWGCPDCDVLLTKMKYHGRSKEQVLHPVGPEGGGIAIARQSPAHMGYPFPLDHYVRRILNVAGIKQTKSVSVYSHVPCGAARLANLSVPQVIELTLVGRGELDNQLRMNGEVFEIIPYLHVNWGSYKDNGPEDNNTYMISRAAWLEARPRYMRELRVLHPTCLLTLTTA